MKIILFSLGTRGDIEPFLTIGEQLQNKGHEVVCAFPIQFQGIAEEMKLSFFGLSDKFLELIEGEKAKIVLGGKGNIFQKFSAMLWMIKESQSMQKEIMVQQHDLINIEQPDFVIYNQKCLYPFVWGIANPGKTSLLSAIPCTIHEFEGHASLGMGSNHGKFLNILTYRFSNFFLFQTIKSSTKKYRKELGMKFSSSDIKNHVLYKEEMIYTISPSLFPRPESWTNNVQIAGYHERNRTRNWGPSKEFLEFLEINEKVVFITFGSMTNPDPEQKTSDILKVFSKHKIPAIVNTASGGLVKPDKYPEHVFFVSNIPYEWIFPRMYAVIHHGGAGTTHTAIKNGCASVIIPHILDQHLWNDIITDLKLGPRGIPIKKFTVKSFEVKLMDVLANPDYKENAEKVGARMKEEDYKDFFMNLIEKKQEKDGKGN